MKNTSNEPNTVTSLASDLRGDQPGREVVARAKAGTGERLRDGDIIYQVPRGLGRAGEERRARGPKVLQWRAPTTHVFSPPKQSETIVGGPYYVAPATIKPLCRVRQKWSYFSKFGRYLLYVYFRPV